MQLRSLFEQTQTLLILFTSYALAVLQNVTVDDAVMSGDVVPRYLPTDSVWNIGNECPTCRAKPDPNRAYNGTWHDATFNATVTGSIEFSYTGSSLYIFFIIANDVPHTRTFTDVNFMLDGVLVGNYIHTPIISNRYEFNVPVYASDSVPFGNHNVTIQPITNSGPVLILFDYLIYTVDVPSPSPPLGTPPAGASTITTSSPTSSMTQRTYSKSTIGGIAGGTVGGVVAVILAVALILCYRRYNRRNDGVPPAEQDIVNPFIIPDGVASAPPTGTTSSPHPVRGPFTNPLLALGNNKSASCVTPSAPPSVPPTSTTQSSSSGEPSSSSSVLLQQVEILRNEVARLQMMHEANGDAVQLPLEAPPEYAS